MAGGEVHRRADFMIACILVTARGAMVRCAILELNLSVMEKCFRFYMMFFVVKELFLQFQLYKDGS